MSTIRSARELIELVLDAASFVSWDEPVDASDWPAEYQDELAIAAARTGSDESVLTGRGTIGGRPVAVVVSEFRFLGGSIGRDAAHRIITAVRRATAERLPLLASTSSGGTRMQEGTPAFLQMSTISRVLMQHKAAGLPYLVHLRHPTTGGVFASWGSLGHLTVAEPGALIGFLGPKVYQVLHGEDFPAGVQTAENLASKGVIDGVVPVADLRALVDRALDLILEPDGPSALVRRDEQPTPQRSAWESIEITRRPDRAGMRELLRHGTTNAIRLQGTYEGEHDRTVVMAIARIDGLACVLVGQDRRAQRIRPMGPAALREARRAMKLAGELGLPLVTVIDTPGAELSAAAEEGAIAGEIARSIATLSTLPVPSIAVLLGQGCGGGALALLPADRVIATEHAWLAPLPPEGASAIVFGDAAHAAEMAERQRVAAPELARLGLVDVVIPEREADTGDPSGLARAVAAEIGAQLRSLTAPAIAARRQIVAGLDGMRSRFC